jgi:hypothetical protein
MRRQQPGALLTSARRLDHLIDQMPRERRRQHPQRDPVTEPPTRLDPHLTRTWHDRKNNTVVVLSYGYWA